MPILTDTVVVRTLLPTTMLADCAVCSEGYAPAGTYVCRDCSDVDMRLTVGLAVAVSIFTLVLATATVAHLVRVVEIRTDEDTEGAQGVIGRTLDCLRAFSARAFPLTAVKIVVVVWQIISQVLRGLLPDRTSITVGLDSDERVTTLDRYLPWVQYLLGQQRLSCVLKRSRHAQLVSYIVMYGIPPASAGKHTQSVSFPSRRACVCLSNQNPQRDSPHFPISKRICLGDACVSILSRALTSNVTG